MGTYADLIEKLEEVAANPEFLAHLVKTEDLIDGLVSVDFAATLTSVDFNLISTSLTNAGNPAEVIAQLEKIKSQLLAAVE